MFLCLFGGRVRRGLVSLGLRVHEDEAGEDGDDGNEDNIVLEVQVNGGHYYLALVVELLRFGDPLRFLLPISRQELLLHAWNTLLGRLPLLGGVWSRLVLLDALLDLLADLYLLEGEGQTQLGVYGFAFFGEELSVDGLVELGLSFEFAGELGSEKPAGCVAEDEVGSGAVGLLELRLFYYRQGRPDLLLFLRLAVIMFLSGDIGYLCVADERMQGVLFIHILMAVSGYSEVLQHVLADLLIIASSHQIKQSASRLFERNFVGLYVLLLRQHIVPERGQMNRVALQEFLPFCVLAVVEAPFEGQVPLCQNAKGPYVFWLWEIDELVVCWRVLRNVKFVQDLKTWIGRALLFSKQRRQLAQSCSWKDMEKGQTAKKNSAIQLSLSDFCFFIYQYVLISADNRSKKQLVC